MTIFLAEITSHVEQCSSLGSLNTGAALLRSSLLSSPVQLLVDDLSVQRVALSDLLVLQLVLVVTDGADGDAGILPHRPEVLGDHPLLGLFLSHLAVDVLLTDARRRGPDGSLEDEYNGRLWVVFVKQLETTPLTFVPEGNILNRETFGEYFVSPPLFLYSFRSLDVNYLVKFQLGLVGVLGSIYHPGSVSFPVIKIILFQENVF